MSLALNNWAQFYAQCLCKTMPFLKTSIYTVDILRMAKGFEKCSQNEGKQLIKYSLLENESRYVILHNQALQIFYTHERLWCRGHSGKMYGDVSLFFFFLFCFLQFDPAFFPPFSLFLSFFFCLFLRISYAGPFEPHLIGVDGTVTKVQW